MTFNQIFKYFKLIFIATPVFLSVFLFIMSFMPIAVAVDVIAMIMDRILVQLVKLGLLSEKVSDWAKE